MAEKAELTDIYKDMTGFILPGFYRPQRLRRTANRATRFEKEQILEDIIAKYLADTLNEEQTESLVLAVLMADQRKWELKDDFLQKMAGKVGADTTIHEMFMKHTRREKTDQNAWRDMKMGRTKRKIVKKAKEETKEESGEQEKPEKKHHKHKHKHKHKHREEKEQEKEKEKEEEEIQPTLLLLEPVKPQYGMDEMPMMEMPTIEPEQSSSSSSTPPPEPMLPTLPKTTGHRNASGPITPERTKTLEILVKKLLDDWWPEGEKEPVSDFNWQTLLPTYEEQCRPDIGNFYRLLLSKIVEYEKSAYMTADAINEILLREFAVDTLSYEDLKKLSPDPLEKKSEKSKDSDEEGSEEGEPEEDDEFAIMGKPFHTFAAIKQQEEILFILPAIRALERELGERMTTEIRKAVFHGVDTISGSNTELMDEEEIYTDQLAKALRDVDPNLTRPTFFYAMMVAIMCAGTKKKQAINNASALFKLYREHIKDPTNQKLTPKDWYLLLEMSADVRLLTPLIKRLQDLQFAAPDAMSIEKVNCHSRYSHGQHQCAYCGAPASMMCTKCKAVCYCCKSHQELDWHAHAPVCML